MIPIIISLAVLTGAGLVLLVSRRPSTFHIERSVTIHAPASAIFPHINASRGWEAWSPWIEIDPDAVYTYEGPGAGVGAVTQFSGRKSGTGTVTVTESRPAELIRFRLEMTKPFRCDNQVAFTFDAAGPEKTKVTWSMSGSSTFMSKLMGLFVNCEEMCGKSFAKGLHNLKTLVEGTSVPRAFAPTR